MIGQKGIAASSYLYKFTPYYLGKNESGLRLLRCPSAPLIILASLENVGIFIPSLAVGLDATMPSEDRRMCLSIRSSQQANPSDSCRQAKPPSEKHHNCLSYTYLDSLLLIIMGQRTRSKCVVAASVSALGDSTSPTCSFAKPRSEKRRSGRSLQWIKCVAGCHLAVW